MEKEACTTHQANRLKALGVQSLNQTFSLAELGELLFLQCRKFTVFRDFCAFDSRETFGIIVKMEEFTTKAHGRTEAEARAAMLIYLLERKQSTPPATAAPNKQ